MDKRSGRIQIHFHPNEPERGGMFAVEKSEGGVKRRYLEGVSSGLMFDGHGERMTENCIKSFMRQAKSGDVLLYAGLHGVDFSDDIGILVDANILPTGDWWTKYRLYDELDGMGASTLERVDKIWRQLNGLPPYSKPKQKGFSIEGDIPEGGIKVVDESGRRVMDDVLLDGVVLVNRPAYRDSVAHAVYKALGEPAPWQIRKNLESTLREKIAAASDREEYWRKCYALQDALDAEVRRVMSGPEGGRKSQLDDVLKEYVDLYATLVLEHPEMYQPTDGAVASGQSAYKTQSATSRVLKALESNMRLLVEIKKANQESTNGRKSSKK